MSRDDGYHVPPHARPRQENDIRSNACMSIICRTKFLKFLFACYLCRRSYRKGLTTNFARKKMIAGKEDFVLKGDIHPQSPSL